MERDFQKCGLPHTLKVVGSKWTIAIIYELVDGPKRFNDIQKGLMISPRTLSLRLQQLEQDGIVNKKVYNEMPPHVEYRLTKKGESLEQIIQNMCDWGERTKV